MTPNFVVFVKKIKLLAIYCLNVYMLGKLWKFVNDVLLVGDVISHDNVIFGVDLEFINELCSFNHCLLHIQRMANMFF